MLKTDLYYYTDSTFQLELNLQNIRRELIQLIDESEQPECVECFQMKCRCSTADHNTVASGPNLILVDPFKNEDGSPKAPPANSLPLPTFGKSDESPGASTPEKETTISDIEAWIKNCGKLITPDKRGNADALLANLKKLDAQPKVPEVREVKEVSAATAVEAFFNSFKIQPFQNGGSSAVTYISSKLTTSYVQQQPRKAEYSYF